MPQTLSKILVHAVFSTKHREPLLRKPLRDPLCAYIGAVLRDLGSPAITIGVSREHVHLLLVLSRSQALSRVVMEVKRSSSKWFKERGVHRFAWQAGYAAFSVSQSALEQVQSYIAAQEEHHEKMSFVDEYRALLKRYRIEFDERYVWD